MDFVVRCSFTDNLAVCPDMCAKWSAGMRTRVHGVLLSVNNQISGRKPWRAALAHDHGVNTLAMADFRLPL